MMNKPQPLRSLKFQWSLLSVSVAVYLLLFSGLLTLWWDERVVLPWSLATGAVCIYLLAVLWFALPENHRHGETTLLPGLGAGSLLTLARGILFSALAGFAVSPLPPGALVWFPGCIYIVAGIADLFDGYLARRGNHVTRLGERLDMTLDGVGVLLAAWLLYHYQKLPWWILLVGAARYVFIILEWILTRLGKPTRPLPSSRSRRGFAGAVMGFLGAALLPVFTPPITVWVGVLFVTPFLFGFVRDIFIMSGVIPLPPEDSRPSSSMVYPLLFRGLPVFLRGLLLVLAVVRLNTWRLSLPEFLTIVTPLGTAQAHFVWVVVFYLLGSSLLVLGVIGRLGGMILLIAVGLQYAILPLGKLEAGILLCASGIFFLGSGAFSLWQPEQRLIERRLGEK